MCPAAAQVLDALVPAAAHDVHATYGARGAAAKRDLEALAVDGNTHVVIAPAPGGGARASLDALAAVLSERAGFDGRRSFFSLCRRAAAPFGPVGFRASRLPAGGHLAPLTHPDETAAHLAALLTAPAGGSEG